MTTRLPAPERRALIEEAAARLFAEHGYEGTRLEDVARAAHVTKPILYRHFASKSELYVALLERHRADLPSFVSPHDMATPLDRLLPVVLDRWFAYVQARPHTWVMIFRDSGGDSAVREARAAVVRSARAVMEGIVAAVPGVPEEEVVAAAELVRTGMAGLALWWMDNPDVPRATLVAVTARLLRGVPAR